MLENDKNNVAYYKKKKKDDEEVIGKRKEPTLRAPSSTKTNTPTEAEILYQDQPTSETERKNEELKSAKVSSSTASSQSPSSGKSWSQVTGENVKANLNKPSLRMRNDVQIKPVFGGSN